MNYKSLDNGLLLFDLEVLSPILYLLIYWNAGLRSQLRAEPERNCCHLRTDIFVFIIRNRQNSGHVYTMMNVSDSGLRKRMLTQQCALSLLFLWGFFPPPCTFRGNLTARYVNLTFDLQWHPTFTEMLSCLVYIFHQHVGLFSLFSSQFPSFHTTTCCSCTSAI